MKHSRVRPPVRDELRDLDRLVLAEIDAIQQESSRKRMKEGDPREARSRSPSVVQRPLRSTAREKAQAGESSWGDELPAQEEFGDADSRAARRPGPSELHSVDETDHEAHDVFDYEGDRGERPGEPSEGLLSKEEEVFVRHVVQWLRPRKTKDMIWARVWSHLTEEESEEFYSPETESFDPVHEAPHAHKADGNADDLIDAPTGDPEDDSA